MRLVGQLEHRVGPVVEEPLEPRELALRIDADAVGDLEFLPLTIVRTADLPGAPGSTPLLWTTWAGRTRSVSLEVEYRPARR